MASPATLTYTSDNKVAFTLLVSYDTSQRGCIKITGMEGYKRNSTSDTTNTNHVTGYTISTPAGSASFTTDKMGFSKSGANYVWKFSPNPIVIYGSGTGTISVKIGKTGNTMEGKTLTSNDSVTVDSPISAPRVTGVTTSPSRTGCSFNVSYSVDSGDTFSYRTIKWGTSTAYSGGSTSGTSISGLSPNTTYYYSVTVTSSIGGTSSAYTGSFKTTCNAPSSLSMSRVSSTTSSIAVGVSATGDTNAGITNYTVYYRAGTSGGYSSRSLGTSTSVTISSLSVDTNYQFYFTATNAGGTTTSSTYTYSTLLNNPTITTPVVSNLLPFSCTIAATGSVSPSRTLQYRFSNDNGNSWTSYQNSNSYNWTGLDEEKIYHMQVQVKATKVGTNASDTTATSSLTITTPADIAKVHIKVNDVYKKGKAYFKYNNQWVKAKKLYIKVNGEWRLNNNDNIH